MSKLIISRKKEWQNRARKYKVYIDGEKKDIIENGKIKEMDLEPGKHQVQLKIDWCSSPEIELEIPEDRSKTIEVSTYKLNGWISKIMYLLFGSFFLIKIFLNKEIKELIIVMIPFFLIFLYYLTFGRKKYIEIREL
jgi:hypothetical protein